VGGGCGPGKRKEKKKFDPAWGEKEKGMKISPRKPPRIISQGTAEQPEIQKKKAFGCEGSQQKGRRKPILIP